MLHTKTLPEKSKKTLTQQIFHPGLFHRQRSASLNDINQEKHIDNQTSKKNNQSVFYNANAPWQRVPNQKLNRSPDEKEARINQAKRPQRREITINKHKEINNFDQNTSPGIETTNSFSLLDVEVGEAPPKRIPKPPPIILYGVDDLAKLNQFIEEVVEKDDFSYKVVSRNQLIISSHTIDKYKTLIEHIRNKGLIGHTFTRKDQKCTRIVIKHLHFSTPKEAIVEAIEKTGNRVQGEIVTARKQGTKEPLNTFFVNIAPHDNNKLVKEIQYIYNQKVTIEDPIKKSTVVQCTRCQQYGHSKNNCMRPYRCVKCAGPHKTTMCTIDENTPAVCALCSGSHPASYKGCQIYKEIVARKHTRSRHEPQSKARTALKALKNDTVPQETTDGTNTVIVEPVKNPRNGHSRSRQPSVIKGLYSEAVKNSSIPAIDITKKTHGSNPRATADHMDQHRTQNDKAETPR